MTLPMPQVSKGDTNENQQAGCRDGAGAGTRVADIDTTSILGCAVDLTRACNRAIDFPSVCTRAIDRSRQRLLRLRNERNKVRKRRRVYEQARDELVEIEDERHGAGGLTADEQQELAETREDLTFLIERETSLRNAARHLVRFIAATRRMQRASEPLDSETLDSDSSTVISQYADYLNLYQRTPGLGRRRLNQLLREYSAFPTIAERLDALIQMQDHIADAVKSPKPVGDVSLPKDRASLFTAVQQALHTLRFERKHGVYRSRQVLQEFSSSGALVGVNERCLPELLLKLRDEIADAEPLSEEQRELAPAWHPLLEEMNERYFVAQEGGKAAICEWRWDPEMNRHTLVRLRPADFQTLWKHQKSPDTKLTVAEAWLQHPDRRTYSDVVFMPGRAAPPGTFNLWRGFDVQPAAGNCTLFKKFMLDIICAGDRDNYQYLFRWMARAVQRPDEPGMTAVVLRGRQRTGKGFFANQFGRLFGQHFMAVSNPKHLVGNFNSHLRDVCVLFCDEALFAGDRSIVGPLKSLITEPTLTIEAKFFDARSVRNHLHVIMASNEDHVVPADRTGEAKRFLVLDVSAAHAADKQYFATIAQQMRNGGAAALLHELLAEDLAGFDVENVPSTAGRVEQQLASLEDVASWWYDVLQKGDLPAVHHATDEKDKGWPSGSVRFVKSALHGNYERWAEKRRLRRVKSETEFGAWMPQLLKDVPVETIRLSGDGRPRAYRLPPLGECRAAFERFIGAKVTWHHDLEA